MTDIAIQVENISKQYRIGSPQASYKTLRDSLASGIKAPFQKVAKLLRGEAYGAATLNETIWALKNVSFQVKQGEVLGIIGANGAGKTTLLKILSSITEPTEGYAEIRGRVGSLLEVG
ncbi:MAG: ATP-binding cassette domain-containing protein, partial [Candidatus Neomarinimicrobiota bacterium]